jgi:hypothetical protein
MTNEERIAELAQDIYVERHNQVNGSTGTALTNLLGLTITWINKLIPEIEKRADWNFVRTNDDSVGTVLTGTTIAYPLPSSVRKLVVSPYRDLTIQQDSTIVSTFRLVNPNQQSNPVERYEIRDRATVLRRNVIFSRSLTDAEVGGTIVADTIEFIPKLSYDDVSLLDIFDDYPDIRQLFVLGVVKNQILPDIVQGGLTPSYSQKFDRYLADCISENNASAEADDADRENFGWVSGVF